MATQQQARQLIFVAGGTNLPGTQNNDYRAAQQAGWIIRVPTAVQQEEAQSGGNTYIYWLMKGYSSTTVTTTQLAQHAVARTIFASQQLDRKLRTQWQSSTQTYYNATKLFNAEGGVYPPNQGGTNQFAIYVSTNDSAGNFSSSFPQAYKCLFQQQSGYPVSSGNWTITSQDSRPIVNDSQNGVTERDVLRSTGYYTRSAYGQASNQQHIWYLSQQVQSTLPSNTSGFAARSFTTNTTRNWRTVGETQDIVTTVPYGQLVRYRIYTRVYSGSTSNNSEVFGQGSAARIWDRVYYMSQGTYQSWYVGGIDDQVTLNPTSFQITEAQAQSTSTQLQTLVDGNTGQHRFRFSLNTSGAIGSAAGINSITNGATSKQINISNSNSLFPGAGQSDQFYLWVNNYADSSSQYHPTNPLRSVTIETQAAQDTTPNAPQLNPTSYAGAATSTYYTAGWETQGVSSGVQVPWQGVNAQLSTNGTSWSTSIQRAQGQQAYIRVLSSSQQNATVTGTVRFAQQTSIDADLSVTTGSGGGTSQGGGTGNYGIAIRNSTGQSVIIDQSSRIGSLLNNTSLQFYSGQTGANSSGKHAFSGVNCQDDNKIAVVYRSDIFSQFQPVCQITRRTAGQQYGITVKVPFEIPAQQSPQAVDLWLLRF